MLDKINTLIDLVSDFKDDLQEMQHKIYMLENQVSMYETERVAFLKAWKAGNVEAMEIYLGAKFNKND